MKNNYEEWGIVLQRVVLGGIFLVHGWMKVTNLPGTLKFFSTIGMPEFLAYAVIAIEVVGGACLLLGLFTRGAAAVIGVVLLGTIKTLLQMGKGFVGGYEFNIALLALAVALVCSGSRLLALDNKLAELWLKEKAH